MRRVIVESPYRGANQAERLRNVSYLKRCLRDCIMRGESPYASHGLLPGALEEDRAEERALGIVSGFVWWEVAELIVFYTDYGWSKGMDTALLRAQGMGYQIEERQLNENNPD